MQHEPTPACDGMHCYSCMVDEPTDRPFYIICGECGHVYYTAGELRREYRRRVLAQRWSDVPRWRQWVKVWTKRASKIYFCQHCIHDF